MKEGMTVLLPEGMDKEDLKRRATALGVKYTVLAQEGIGIIMDWDISFYFMLKDWSEALHVSLGRMIENMLIKRFAAEEATKEVWGPSGEKLLPEFSVMGKRMLTGPELFAYLKRLSIEEEEWKRVEFLLREEAEGRQPLLTDDDKAFLIKKRAGITWLESEEYAKEQQKEKEAKAKMTPKQKEALEYAREKIKEGGK